MNYDINTEAQDDKEVGYIATDSSTTRLPNSVNSVPVMGDSAYGTNEYAKNTPLDAKISAGIIGTAHIGGDYVPVPQKTANITGPTGVVETTYDHTNRSAQFKYPNVTQDYPAKDGPSQFTDHS